MNIYYCVHDYAGYQLSAVVQAVNEQRAIGLLDWENSEDITEIDVKQIGIAIDGKEQVWCKESL